MNSTQNCDEKKIKKVVLVAIKNFQEQPDQFFNSFISNKNVKK